MELEYYLELFDKYECSQWFLGQILGGFFAIFVFSIFLITLCVNFTIYFINYLNGKEK